MDKYGAFNEPAVLPIQAGLVFNVTVADFVNDLIVCPLMIHQDKPNLRDISNQPFVHQEVAAQVGWIAINERILGANLS